MKKREFLATAGAVPLMLAGCGGNGSGSAPVRLVNASVGYPSLGFMVDTTQATSSDVAYGAASPFETVEAGSITTALTITGSTGTVSSLATTTRTLSKDSRYSLIAYGYLNELKSLLLTESTVTPDDGEANINVLNTSVDIGAVDVYLSTTAGTDLSTANLIASSVSGVSQSVFSGVTAATATSTVPGSQYYITVVGAGSLAKGLSDVRFTSATPITLTALEVATIILTPGASGVLANAILLVQGTGTTTGTTSFSNATARVRAISAFPAGTPVVVTATSGTTATTTTVLSTSTPDYSNYVVVTTGTAPTVKVNGATVALVTTTTSGTAAPTTLAAGGDYTLMIYTTAGGVATAQLVLDDNTAPVSSTGVKTRLINLAVDNQSLQLSMSINSLSVASAIPYGGYSSYTDLTVPQTVNSVIEVFNGTTQLKTRTQVLTTGNIFTEIVTSVPSNYATAGISDIFRSASGN